MESRKKWKKRAIHRLARAGVGKSRAERATLFLREPGPWPPSGTMNERKGPGEIHAAI